jgi:MFS family permease
VTVPEQPDGVWGSAHRRLTVSLVLTVTLVAFESLSVATALPVVSRDLGDVRLYGWVFSAFFLGSLVGIVVAGGQADRKGLRMPFTVGLVLFAGGLAVAGLAPNMPVLVAARTVQGFGAGAIPAAAYVSIGRGYPESLRPRMFAILSTAWVVPGLVGPAAAGLVADHLGWRWVFLGLLPLVVAAGALTLPAVAGIAPPVEPATAPIPLADAIRVASGAGLLLAGLTVASPLPSTGLILAGGIVGLPSLVRLLPSGTLRGRRGLAAAVAVRGVLTFAFFGADAYVPLTITSIRGATATTAGLTLTCSTLLWTAGSWVQERMVIAAGARRFIRSGLALILVGIALVSLLLWPAAPILVGPVAWSIAGFGIGLAYAPLSLTVLHEAPAGQEGRASAGLQLADVLGTALGTGVCGAAVAFGHRRGWAPRSGLAGAFGIAFVVGVFGLALARRVPKSFDPTPTATEETR